MLEEEKNNNNEKITQSNNENDILEKENDNQINNEKIVQSNNENIILEKEKNNQTNDNEKITQSNNENIILDKENNNQNKEDKKIIQNSNENIILEKDKNNQINENEKENKEEKINNNNEIITQSNNENIILEKENNNQNKEEKKINENDDLNNIENNLNNNEEFKYYIPMGYNLESLPMYLSNPNLISGTMKDYISYTFSGKDIDTPLNRRFSDFLILRQKLVERWPGIFIPIIPPKKAIKNNDERTINKRLRMLNRFLFKISNTFLNYSDEIKKFKTVPDIQKELESMKKPSYLEILEKYELVFNEKKENFDLSIGKTKVKDFLIFLKKIHKSVSDFYDKFKNMFIKKQSEKNLYLEVIKNFQDYEKNNIKGYADEDDNKLVFFNANNYNLFNRLIKLKDALFDISQPLYEFFQDERLDIEGLIEALEGINKLIETHSKSIEKLENIKKDLNSYQSGNKKGIKAIFKNKDQIISDLETDKMKTEEDIKVLGKIIDLVVAKMEDDIEYFKEERVKEYYKNIKKFSIAEIANRKIIRNLWKEITQIIEINNLIKNEDK